MSIMDILKSAPEKQRAQMLAWSVDKTLREERRIYSLTCELTPCCNLNCKMCYVRQTPEEAHRQGGFLSVAQWLSYIKQAKDLGGLFHVALTGGECLSYPYFYDLYSEIYNLGLQVIVMTNATLVNKETIEFFLKMPPEQIDITLYGFSAQTYERTCGNAVAFEKVINAIEALKRVGMPMRIKCTLTREMMDDFPRIAQYANKMNIPFSYNNTLKANRECTYDTVLENEISYDEMRELEQLASVNDGIELCEAKEINVGEDFEVKSNGVLCAAGRNSCHINWKGELTPCVTLDVVKCDLRKMSLKEAWSSIVEWADNVPAITECQKCRFYFRCKHCLAIHWGDTGEFGKPSPRLCYKIQHGITD